MRSSSDTQKPWAKLGKLVERASSESPLASPHQTLHHSSVSSRKSPPKKARRPRWYLIIAALPFILTGIYWFLSGNPIFFLVYLIASLVTFALTYRDKQQAIRQRARWAERTLHLWELCGGWPGGLLGQQAFRHKTRKLSYQATFWSIVLLHLGIWIYLIWRRVW